MDTATVNSPPAARAPEPGLDAPARRFPRLPPVRLHLAALVLLLLAAAIFGLAFLPIFYSHLALNDVPTLAPVALALYAASGVMRRGRRRDYVLAGLGVGLAAATKYTGAYTAFCVLVAAACDAADGSVAPAARRLGLAALVALGSFVLANPYALLHFAAFQAGVS